MGFKHIYKDVQFIFIDSELLAFTEFFQKKTYHDKLFQNKKLYKINELHSTLRPIDLGYYFLCVKYVGNCVILGNGRRYGSLVIIFGFSPLTIFLPSHILLIKYRQH